MLGAIAGGADLDDIAPDWVTLQRLRQFGLIDEIPDGHKVTAAGRRVLASGQGPDTKAWASGAHHKRSRRRGIGFSRRSRLAALRARRALPSARTTALNRARSGRGRRAAKKRSAKDRHAPRKPAGALISPMREAPDARRTVVGADWIPSEKWLPLPVNKEACTEHRQLSLLVAGQEELNVRGSAVAEVDSG